MRAPRTRYVRSGDVYVATQITGIGPPDILMLPPIYYGNLEHVWTHHVHRHALERLSAFGRLIQIDRRGSGLSDPVCGPVTIDDHVDDVLAVLDAAGSEQ